MAVKKDKLIIIDGNALLHRAWHAIPPLTNKKGVMTNAVYGFTTILIRVLKELKPKYIAVTFDLKEPTFRHQEYKEYKANRIKQPDELYDQLPLVKQVIKAFNLPIYEVKGFEADDVIGTIARQIDKIQNIETYIVTGDMDTLQLVNNNTKVYTLKKGIADTVIYDDMQVKKKYGGLLPGQLVDYKALRGDSSDNIPGVKGIGEKTAIELLKTYKTLENLYKNFTKSTTLKPRIKELLKTYKSDAFMSKKLATIVTNAPIDFNIDRCIFTGVDYEKTIKLFQELEFKSLLAKIPELEKDLKIKTQKTPSKQNDKYLLIDNEKDFKKFVKNLKTQKIFAIDTETSSLNFLETKLIGISIAWQKGEAFFLDWQKIKTYKKTLKKFKEILVDKNYKKVGHNIKFDIAVLKEVGLDINGIEFDTMIAAYLLHPGESRLKLDNLVFSYFGHQMIPIEDLIGVKGKNQLSMSDIPIKKITNYAAEDADYTFRLYKKLLKEIKSAKLNNLMKTIETPLIKVLYRMEKNGVLIDKKFLKKLQKEIAGNISKLTKKIYSYSKQEFNIASPKQLKEILFDKLQIPTMGLKKTKTGISTAAGELEKMKNLHPIIPLISEYRELTKLQSTYIEALPKLISPKTGRIHTNYNQTITATGRLSSSNPNLQNIPIRTELGKKIRGAFIADKNYKLITADYSQIELRIVAHLADDKNMIKAFQEGRDIHRATAALIFNIPFEKVDDDIRRQAKEINFGVLYGMGAFGLAQRTGISRPEAQNFINRYFKTFDKIKKYTENTIKQAKEKGYVQTIFGRRRFLPEINSGIAMVRKATERAAINMPVQGTAADIIKLAMIQVDKKLENKYPQTKMIMQVHDEIVLEVPEKNINEVAKIVKQTMQSIITLKVPLIADVKIGDNWLEMKKIKS